MQLRVLLGKLATDKTPSFYMNRSRIYLEQFTNDYIKYKYSTKQENKSERERLRREILPNRLREKRKREKERT